MLARAGVLVLCGSLVAAPASGQALQRERTIAFPVSLTLFAGLGFGGQRANRIDTLTCASRECFGYKVGSAPYGGFEIQIPLSSTLGVGLAGTIGRPSRVICIRGLCQSPDRFTQVHAAGLLLWRFKPRAPIYFGLGPGGTYSKPGPIYGQSGAITEIGGVAVLAYDLDFGGRVGLRVAWWHWLLRPKTTGLGSDFDPNTLGWDQLFTAGARISLGS